VVVKSQQSLMAPAWITAYAPGAMPSCTYWPPSGLVHVKLAIAVTPSLDEPMMIPGVGSGVGVGVGLGVLLPDPDHLLTGSGTQLRYFDIALDSPLPAQSLAAFIEQAIALPPEAAARRAMVRDSNAPS
jgi:hypothetical protein